MRELDQLTGHYFIETVDPCDAVSERDHRPDLVHLDALFVVVDLLPQQLRYLIRANLCHVFILYL